MDYSEDTPDGEEGTEASGSVEDQRQGVVLISLGMLLVRASLAGDSHCGMDYNSLSAYCNFYDAHVDAWLLNLN